MSTGRSYPPPPEPLRAAVPDSHCHLDTAAGVEAPTVEDAVAAAVAVGVTRIVQVGCDVESARWSVTVAREHAELVAAVALHPNEAPRLHDAGGRAGLETAWAEIETLAADPWVRAVGETGLDYYRTPEGSGRQVQEESFRWHIALAKRLGKALVVHDRDAHDDVVRVLLEEGPPEHVVLHCFSGGPDLARTCAEHGFVMSFAGTVTFRNAEPLREALRVAPLDLLLVETDAPFLTPVPYRGRPNASYLVPLTLRSMAHTRQVDEEVLATAVTATTERVFGPW